MSDSDSAQEDAHDNGPPPPPPPLPEEEADGAHDLASVLRASSIALEAATVRLRKKEAKSLLKIAYERLDRDLSATLAEHAAPEETVALTREVLKRVLRSLAVTVVKHYDAELSVLPQDERRSPDDLRAQIMACADSIDAMARGNAMHEVSPVHGIDEGDDWDEVCVCVCVCVLWVHSF